MKYYFLDTNVVLDFLARREPFAGVALEIFRAGLEGRATLYVASLSFATVHYVMRKHTSTPVALSLVAELATKVTVVTVNAAVVERATTGFIADFEDGLQYFSALSVPALDAIVTRNVRDFKKSTLLVFTPEQAISNL